MMDAKFSLLISLVVRGPRRASSPSSVTTSRRPGRRILRRIGRTPGPAGLVRVLMDRTCWGACRGLHPLLSWLRTDLAERSSAAGCVGVASLWPRGGCPNGAGGGAFARLLRWPPGHERDECFSRASRLPGCYWLPGRRLFSGTECSLAPSKLAARAPPPSSPLGFRPRPRIPGGPSDAVGRSGPTAALNSKQREALRKATL